MSALVAASEAIQCLNKKFIDEIKAFKNPPRDVKLVLEAVMTLLDKPIDWVSIRKELA